MADQVVHMTDDVLAGGDVERKPETHKEKDAVARFRVEVCYRSAEVDPKENFDWYVLSTGFFLACGLSPEVAVEMALHVRYDCNYWEEP